MYTASLSPLPSDSRQLTPPIGNASNITTIATVKSEPLAAAAATVAPSPSPVSPPPPSPPIAKPRSAPEKVASAGNSVPLPAATIETAAKTRSGWIVQVGALPDEKEAKQRLETAQGKAKDLLGKADSFTERVEKGDKVLFRARFAGLEKDQAEAVCKHLKRSEIPCMLLKN
jgi:D-alanyl-D-alanine carboxypeptidase